MIKPKLDEARNFIGDNTIIPICLEIFSDIKTPIEVLKLLKTHSKECYLLESVESGDKWGRYSFLGFEPELSVVCRDGVIEIVRDMNNEIYNGSPNDVLRKILDEYKSPRLDSLPPFTGGFVGYISYDYIKYFEKSLSLDSFNDTGFDDLNLMLFDKVIAFDHLKQKIFIILNIKAERLEENYIQGVVKLKEIESIIKSEKNTDKFKAKLKSAFKPLFTKEYYCEMVEKAKKHIYDGDIYQAVLSNRLEAEFDGDLLSAYRLLRTINPSSYMMYIDFGDVQIAGSSTETLISLKDGRLSCFPLSETCLDGKDSEEYEKELAKHNILVDLVRNDLGKISGLGTVQVTDYKKLVELSDISYISSVVQGKLIPELDQLDALYSVLPSGALSGVHKLKAIEIINQLEGVKRGIYGGAIGYIDFSGNMDMCIAVRIVVKKNDKVYVSSGTEILADSIPEEECEKCMDKAKAIMEALIKSQEVE